MKLTKIKPHYFRSFGDGPSIDVDSQLIVFLGANGTGKSSLAEALQWFLFGYTTRRRKGNTYSKKEYKGSYTNAHWPGNEPPYVEVEFEIGNTAKYKMRRQMVSDGAKIPDDVDCRLFLNDVEVDGFKAIDLIFSESQAPVIVQHGIQDFVHTKPIDRYRSISEALGLADLVAFKDVVERAKNRYRKQLPERICEAQITLRKLTKHLTETGLSDIAFRWQDKNFDLANDFQRIADSVRAQIHSQTLDLDDLLIELRNRRDLEIGKLFNSNKYRLGNEAVKSGTAIESVAQQLSAAQKRLDELVKNLAAESELEHEKAYLDFWRDGLSLIIENMPSRCPFCEQETFTKEHENLLKSRISASKMISEVERQAEMCRDLLAETQSLLSRVGVAQLDEGTRTVLDKAFTSDRALLEKFISTNRELSSALNSLTRLCAGVQPLYDQLFANNFSVTVGLSVLQSLSESVQNIQDLTQHLPEMLGRYSETFTSFVPAAERELADEDTVSHLSRLIGIFEQREQIGLVALEAQFDAEIVEAQRLIDQYVLEQQKTALESREEQMVSWYKILAPGARTQFSGLVPGREQFSLKADSFGVEISAAACLSQSQLNCLGLSIYIPSIADSSCPFSFIVFDDPVQSFDDEHHESFLTTVIPKLIDEHGLQVIVLTHMPQDARRLYSLNYDRSPLFYVFDQLTADGVQVRKSLNLKEELRACRKKAESSDQQERTFAVDRLRVLSEHFVREAHLKIKGTPMPSEYSAARPSELLRLFGCLPGVSDSHCRQLKDVIEYCDPAHHSSQDWQTPVSSNIIPHINRLSTLINQFKLDES